MVRMVEGIINLVLSLLLVAPFGMVGIAAGTLIAGVITSGWFVPLRACRVLNIGFGRLFNQVLIGAFLFAVAAAAVYPVQRALPGDNLPWLVARFSLVSLWLVLTGTPLLLPRSELTRLIGQNFVKIERAE